MIVKILNYSRVDLIITKNQFKNTKSTPNASWQDMFLKGCIVLPLAFQKTLFADVL